MANLPRVRGPSRGRRSQGEGDNLDEVRIGLDVLLHSFDARERTRGSPSRHKDNSISASFADDRSAFGKEATYQTVQLPSLVVQVEGSDEQQRGRPAT